MKRALDAAFLSAPKSRALSSVAFRFPQFLSLMLGEPDYWAPGDFATHDEHGKLSRMGTYPQCR